MPVTGPVSRRGVLRAAAAAGTALSAASLLAGPVRAAATAPVTITYWYPWGGDSMTYEINRYKTFNATHKDVKAMGLYVPPESGVDNGKLLAAIAAGNPPDLVVVNADYAAAVIGYQGGLLDLSPYLKVLNWNPDQMLPAVLPLMNYNGKIWALPETGNVNLFYWNKTLFRAAGLDPDTPPATTADLDVYAAKLTKSDGKGGFKTIGFIPWAEDGAGAFVWPWAFGADFTKGVGSKVQLTLTDPNTLRATEWEATYAQKYGANSLSTAVSGFGNTFSPNDAFISGELAMMIGGNYHTEAIRTYNPKLDYGVAPMPLPPGGRPLSTILSFNIYMVPVGSQHPQQAVEFAMWAGNGSAVIGNEDVWRTFSGYKQGPGAPQNVWQKAHDPIYAVVEKLAASRNATNGPLLPISSQLSTEMATAEQDVIYGKSTAKQSMSQLQSQLQPILAKDLKQ